MHLAGLKCIPICGEDFCDRCGDCLYCHGGDPCLEDGPHNDATFREKHQYCHDERCLVAEAQAERWRREMRFAKEADDE